MATQGYELARSEGKPVNILLLTPEFFGKTTLHLYKTRIVERTKKLVSTRHCEIPLSALDSIEILQVGAVWLIGLGLLTLALYGLGIVFFILYFFIKNRYVVARSGNNVLAVTIPGGARGIEAAENFMKAVLQQVEDHNQGVEIPR